MTQRESELTALLIEARKMLDEAALRILGDVRVIEELRIELRELRAERPSWFTPTAEA
jgi:hypothetical protein